MTRELTSTHAVFRRRPLGELLALSTDMPSAGSQVTHASSQRLLLKAFTVVPLALLCACSPGFTDKTVTYGPSTKVCQLTGQNDWETGEFTSTRTLSNYGLAATDLGYPVEHQGRLALLFGDSAGLNKDGKRDGFPNALTHRTEQGPPDDAVGWITSREPPTQNRCTDLKMNFRIVTHAGPPSDEFDGPGDAQGTGPVQHPRPPHPTTVKEPVLVHPVVVVPVRHAAHSPDEFVKHGIFNVPSGGVSSGDWLYAFFWTNHCAFGDDHPFDPCPETYDRNMTGHSVLARSSNDGVTFVDPVFMPKGFVYATAVDAAAYPGLPADQRLGTYIFAVPRYRESVPYLAYAPRGELLDTSRWQFFTGRKRDGQPEWISFDAWNAAQLPPGEPEIFPASGTERCVGEFSITWNRGLGVWLLLYNCPVDHPPQQSIVARIADAPWGPWSDATVILSPQGTAGCHLLMTDSGCRGRENYWELQKDRIHFTRGDLYAPFVLDRFTTPVQTFRRNRKEATVYWLVSTWNPYQVVVMRTPISVLDTRARASESRTVEANP